MDDRLIIISNREKTKICTNTETLLINMAKNYRLYSYVTGFQHYQMDLAPILQPEK